MGTASIGTEPTYLAWLKKLVPESTLRRTEDGKHWLVPDGVMQRLALKGMEGLNCDHYNHQGELNQVYSQLRETWQGLAYLLYALKPLLTEEQWTALAPQIQEGERLVGLPQPVPRSPGTVEDAGTPPEDRITGPIYDSLELVGLSTSAFNTLYRADIRRIGELIATERKTLLGVRNLGPKLRREIRAKLAALGYISPAHPGPFLVTADGQWADEA